MREVAGNRWGEAGFTLVEVTVSLGIIVVAMLGMVAALGNTLAGSGTSADTRAALESIRATIEDMRVASMTTFYTDWNGRTFAAPALRPPAAGGPQGRVTLLSEAEAAAYWGNSGLAGGTVDLDWDGIADEAAAPAPGWKAYAVRVSVTFEERARRADRTVDVVTIIYDRGA
jgi:type II secretory pathway pseudopilin PulG